MFDKKMMKYIAIGFAAVSEVLAYTLTAFFIGSLIEKKFENTKPWTSLGVTLLGLGFGFYRLYKVAKKTMDSDDEKN